VDEIAKRMQQMFERQAFGLMTANMPPAEPQRPLCMADLQYAMATMPKPRPNVGKIIESVHMVEQFEDWSKVRSPSRTKRRMRYNGSRIYKQKPKTGAYQMPDGSLVMHPTEAAKLRKMNLIR
jgi:hypothetical protein